MAPCPRPTGTTTSVITVAAPKPPPHTSNSHKRGVTQQGANIIRPSVSVFTFDLTSRRHTLPPRSRIVSGQPWSGKPLKMWNPWAINTIFLADRGHSAGPSLSNPNQIARRKRRWVPLADPHAYVCSASDLEHARLRKYGPNRGLLKQILGTVGY